MVLDSLLDGRAGGFVEPQGESDKLIASDARHRVGAPQYPAERVSHGPQSSVPSAVAAAVVQLLHVVDIEKEKEGCGLLAIGQLEHLRADLYEAPAIAKSGEFVCECQLAQSCAHLHELAFHHHTPGVVAEDRAGPFLALSVAEDLRTHLHFNYLTVASDHPGDSVNAARAFAFGEQQTPAFIGLVGQAVTT